MKKVTCEILCKSCIRKKLCLIRIYKGETVAKCRDYYSNIKSKGTIIDNHSGTILDKYPLIRI